MKESEALNKLCHVKLVKNIEISVTTTYDGYTQSKNCVGSRCMAWEPEYDEERKTFNIGELIPEGWHKISDNAGMINAVKYIPNDKGDCGLLSKEQGCFAQC